jgi:hypothetical protein
LPNLYTEKKTVDFFCIQWENSSYQISWSQFIFMIYLSEWLFFLLEGKKKSEGRYLFYLREEKKHEWGHFKLLGKSNIYWDNQFTDMINFMLINTSHLNIWLVIFPVRISQFDFFSSIFPAQSLSTLFDHIKNCGEKNFSRKKKKILKIKIW